jgi:hypothetical protein
MSEDIVEEPFESAAEKVETSHREAVARLKARVEEAKSAALKKISS